MKCSKHPRYQVKRKPRSECVACNQMWAAKQYEKIINSQDKKAIEDSLPEPLKGASDIFVSLEEFIKMTK